MKKKFVTLALKDIIPYENNPRINDEAVGDVVESIKQCENLDPIEIDENNVILAGHTRLKALQELGYTETECIRYSGLTEKQKKKYRLLSNKTGEKAEWDFDKLKIELADLDFGDFDFGFDLPEDEEEVEIIEVELPEEVETRCKPGDVWQLGEHRLICGDSTDTAVIDRLMGGIKAKMAFTDPPYGVEYTGGIQIKPDGTFIHDNREMIQNDDTDIYDDVFKTLSQNVSGACYVWFADTRAKSLYENAEKYGDIHSLLIWVKNGGYGALNANYKQKHEPCLYWKPKGAALNFVGATTETTVWNIDKDGINKYHPTQKPVALAGKAIRNHKADTVLDLFGGSGSTLIACEQLNRKCYMAELDEHYCDVIIQRWENFTGKEAVLIGDSE